METENAQQYFYGDIGKCQCPELDQLSMVEEEKMQTQLVARKLAGARHRARCYVDLFDTKRNVLVYGSAYAHYYFAEFHFLFYGVGSSLAQVSFKAASVAKFDKAAEVDVTPVAGGWV